MNPESSSTTPGRASPPQSPSEGSPAAWPDRLLELAGILRVSSAEASPDSFAEFWRLLNLVLRNQIRGQLGRVGWVDPSDVEDLASEKALDLVNRFDSGRWKVEESTPAEVAAFLRTVARYGLIDLKRRESRRIVLPPEETDNVTQHHQDPDSIRTESPDAGVDRGDYATALVDCASRLDPRHRTIWIFRAFYDMPSKLIASHPEVALKPTHVDVILQRCRARMRDCMRGKGFDPASPPPGAFAAIWGAFRAAGIARGGADDE